MLILDINCKYYRKLYNQIQQKQPNLSQYIKHAISNGRRVNTFRIGVDMNMHGLIVMQRLGVHQFQGHFSI